MGSRKAQRRQPPPVEDIDESDDPVLNVVRFGFNNVKKYINDTLPKCPTEKGKTAMAGKMEKLLLRLIKAEMVYTKAAGIVTEVVEEMPADDEGSFEADGIIQNCDGIAETANQRVKEFDETLSNEDLKQHPMYERLMSDIEDALGNEGEPRAGSSAASRKKVSNNPAPAASSATGGEEDSDGVEEEEEQGEGEEELEVQNEDELIPTSDPITKGPLIDPVKNKKCGHIYGKASISQMMKKNTKLKCPIPGCSNKDFLRVAHLVADPKLTEEIQKRQQATRKSRRR